MARAVRSPTTTQTAALTAACALLTLGLAGCGDDAPTTTASTAITAHPLEAPGAAPTTSESPPLPAANALTSVITRLADTAVPPAQKVSLVQYATADDEKQLGNFASALAAGGYDQLTVTAEDLAFRGDPGDVTATVTMGSATPGRRTFTFPMEFVPVRGGWQLSRRTADQLLPLIGRNAPANQGPAN